MTRPGGPSGGVRALIGASRKSVRAATPARAALARLMRMAPASRSRPWKRKGGGAGLGGGEEGGPGGGVVGGEALEGEGAGAAGGEAGGDLGGLDREGAGAAHRVEDGLGAGRSRRRGGRGRRGSRAGGRRSPPACGRGGAAARREVSRERVQRSSSMRTLRVTASSGSSAVSAIGAPRVSAMAVAMRSRAAPAW